MKNRVSIHVNGKKVGSAPDIGQASKFAKIFKEADPSAIIMIHDHITGNTYHA